MKFSNLSTIQSIHVNETNIEETLNFIHEFVALLPTMYQINNIWHRLCFCLDDLFCSGTHYFQQDILRSQLGAEKPVLQRAQY